LILGSLFASCGKDNENNGNDTDTTAYIETAKETAIETEADTLDTLPPESVLEEEIRTPIENEKALSFIKFQYAKALEAIEFAKGNLPYDSNNEMISEDGRICYPIMDSIARDELEGESIDSTADLAKYLKSIFARSIADDFIEVSWEFYTDIDGVLCLMTDRMADSFITETETETETEAEETEETEKLPEESESQEEEIPAEPVVISTEFFLSDFTEKLFRYTAKVSFEKLEEEEEGRVEYFDFIFENTGSGWYFTSFPALPQ
jgi:hypothetical protein